MGVIATVVAVTMRRTIAEAARIPGVVVVVAVHDLELFFLRGYSEIVTEGYSEIVTEGYSEIVSGEYLETRAESAA